jgi:hypothetical protein
MKNTEAKKSRATVPLTPDAFRNKKGRNTPVEHIKMSRPGDAETPWYWFQTANLRFSILNLLGSVFMLLQMQYKTYILSFSERHISEDI